MAIKELSRGIPPSEDILRAIEPFLSKDIDELMEMVGLAEDDGQAEYLILSATEKKLVEDFRRLNPKGKNLLLKIIETMFTEAWPRQS